MPLALFFFLNVGPSFQTNRDVANSACLSMSAGWILAPNVIFMKFSALAEGFLVNFCFPFTQENKTAPLWAVPGLNVCI